MAKQSTGNNATSWLSSHRRVTVLATMMAIVAITASSVSIYVVYTAALQSEKERLFSYLKSRATLIENLADNRPGLGDQAALLNALRSVKSHDKKQEPLYRSSEIYLAYKDGDSVFFLSNLRATEQREFSKAPDNSAVAKNVNRAATGATSTLVTTNESGISVLIGSYPAQIGSVRFVIGAHVEMQEVRQPFIAAAIWSSAGSSLVIAFGMLVFWRAAKPIFEREQTEREFRTLLVETAPDAMVITDAEGVIVLINEQAERLMAWPRSELVGHSVGILPPSRMRKEFLCAIEESILSGRAKLELEEGLNLVVVSKDGREIPVEITISPMEINGRRMVSSSIRDISERKKSEADLARSKNELVSRVVELEHLRRKMESQADHAFQMTEELRDAKEQLTNAVESISEGFALWDVDDTLLMCNSRYEHIYANLANVIRPGMAFEKFVQEAFTRGVFPKPEGDLEKAIEDRVGRHRTSVSSFEQELGDGRWLRVSKRRTDAGHVVGIVSDISDRKHTEATIKRMALEDSLTGLPNRSQFHSRLDDAIGQAARHGRLVGLMLLDLDRFKHVNDSLGHPAGDELLCQVSARLLECTRQTDTVARLGGDEFAIIATNCIDDHNIELLAQRIVDAIAKPFQLQEGEAHTGASIGVTIFPFDEAGADQLLSNADLALYRAKEMGRGAFQVYDQQMNIEVQAQRALEKDLRHAFESEEFEIAYQPQFNMKSGDVVGIEALLRWNHSEHGYISPAEFIPIAESTGLIIPITQWLLRATTKQNKAWQAAGATPVCVSVNLSPVHFKKGGLEAHVRDALIEADLESKWLELEITEGAAMEGGDSAAEILTRLREMGVKLAIDDFGTGYSSLDRLKNIQVDRLKIDQSFVRDAAADPDNLAICAAAIRLGQSLNIRVLAEGVETAEQLSLLVAEGCEEAQGFYFSKPLGAHEIPDLLAAADAGRLGAASAQAAFSQMLDEAGAA
jgi:diguanylate cyclase (GGDEF)-like protein/PAS domain S-box-containing protein